LPCNPGVCTKCTGPGPDECSECDDDYYLITDTNTCSKTCPIGSFKFTNGDGKRICTPCLDASNC
jgi:hypothetical protein